LLNTLTKVSAFYFGSILGGRHAHYTESSTVRNGNDYGYEFPCCITMLTITIRSLYKILTAYECQIIVVWINCVVILKSYTYIRHIQKLSNTFCEAFKSFMWCFNY